MNELELTAANLMLLIALLAAVLILGVGVLPLLKSLTGFVEDKREALKKGITGVDSYFADNSTSMGATVLRDVIGKVDIKPTDPGVIMLANSQLLTQVLALMNKVAPETPDRITAEELARIGNDVTRVLRQATDEVRGNVVIPMEPPAPAG